MLTLGASRALYYELIEGAAGRPTLVFLHEGLGCTALWRDFPRLLCAATGCPGLVYDRLGYGLSAPLTRARGLHYLHEYALLELPAVLEALLPGRDYVLVGHSDGGTMALIHASERPAGLRAVICEAAHVFVEPETLAGVRVAVEAYQVGKLGGLARYHGDKTDGLFWAWAATWLSDWFRHWSVEYVLSAIDCPALIIQGRDDQYATPAHVAAIAGRLAGARQALLEGCGHAPHQERQDEVLLLMQEFLTPLVALT